MKVLVNVFDNPYFMQRLETAELMYKGTLENFDKFCKSLEEFENEQDYFEYYNSVKENVINDIKEKEGFKRFNSESRAMYNDGKCAFSGFVFEAEPWSESKKQNLYSENNDGKEFISIDMKKANFNSVRAFDESIFNNCDTWEEYISKFTDKPCIIGSKYIRQVIMGACNPGRQIVFEQWLMLNVLKNLRDSNAELKVFSLTGDEIIIRAEDMALEDINDAIQKAVIHEALNITKFRLEKVKDSGVYMRRYTSGRVEFKCLESETSNQIIKYYNGMEVTDDDLVFYHNGRLVKFLEPIKNPWE